MNRRIDRVNDLLREELSNLIRLQLKDPRLDGLLTITEVECSRDLAHARVFISSMKSDNGKDSVIQGLESASGFLRRELRGRLNIKRVPELHFFLDISIERGDEILDLIDSVSNKTIDQEESTL